MKNLFTLFFISVTFCFSQNIDNTFNPFETNEYDQSYGHKYFKGNGYIFKDGTSLVLKDYSSTILFKLGIVKLDYNGKKDASFLFNTLPQDIGCKVFANETTKKFVIHRTDNVINYFNENGSIISSFNSPVIQNTLNSDPIIINKILLQNDNKFLIIGFFDKVNNLNYKNIVRLNSDGSVDTSFNVGTGFNEEIKCVAQQTNGKYIVLGKFTQFNNATKYYAARINLDGSNDSSFNINRVFSSQSASGISYGFREVIFNNLLMQSDGKILVAGSYFVSNFNIVSKGITRFNTDGTRDTTFNLTNNPSGYYPNTLDLQSDGKIITNNIINNGRPYRLSVNGSVDNTFVSEPCLLDSDLKMVSLNNQKIMTFGDFLKYNSNDLNNTTLTRKEIFRFNNNGAIDLSYKPQAGFNVGHLNDIHYSNNQNEVTKIEILPTNNLLIKGRFSTYNDKPFKNLVKTDQNGNIDLDFNFSNTYSIDYSPNYDISHANNYDDKFYVIGKNQTQIVTGNNTPIFKFNSNGTIDNSYINFQCPITTYKLLPDNKLLLSGSTDCFKNGNLFKLIKLQENGEIDTFFNSALLNSSAKVFDLQADGKIIVVTENKVCYRLNTDGSIDNTFVSLTLNDFIGLLVVAPNDKIFYISNYDNNLRKLKCLNSDGTIDSSFIDNTIGTLYGESYSISSLPLFLENSKMLIFREGYWNTVASTDSSYLISNYSGNVLNSFQIKNDKNIPINSKQVVQNCNDVIFFGGFCNVGNQYNAGIVRYNLGNFTSTPTPTANSLQTFTQGQSLGDLVVNGQNIKWYSSQNSCIVDNVLNFPNTTLLENNTIYYASQTINGIESNHRFPVKVTNSVLSNDSFSTIAFNIIPNPATESIEIMSNLDFEKIEIYNTLGQLVKKVNYNSTNKYDISSLSNGFYNVIFIDSNSRKISNKRLIKN